MPSGPGSPFGAAPGAPGQFPGQPGGTTAGNTGDSGSTVGGYGSTVGGSAPAAAAPSTPGLTGGMNPANGLPGSGPQNGAAANMIQQMLMSPRPGGANGLGLGQAGTVVGGGMAGVASKMDSEGLMVYNDRTNYKEWEFIYDPTKDRPRQDPRAMLVGNQMGTPSNTAAGNTTPSSQPAAFNQPAQTGTNALTGPGAPTGTSGQTGTNGQAGTPANPGTSSQGGAVDIRPGKK
jgi:hypothetical protein